MWHSSSKVAVWLLCVHRGPSQTLSRICASYGNACAHSAPRRMALPSLVLATTPTLLMLLGLLGLGMLGILGLVLGILQGILGLVLGLVLPRLQL